MSHHSFTHSIIQNFLTHEKEIINHRLRFAPQLFDRL